MSIQREFVNLASVIFYRCAQVSTLDTTADNKRRRLEAAAKAGYVDGDFNSQAMALGSVSGGRTAWGQYHASVACNELGWWQSGGQSQFLAITSTVNAEFVL